MIDRRSFPAGTAAVLPAAPPVAEAQQPAKTGRIGVLSLSSGQNPNMDIFPGPRELDGGLVSYGPDVVTMYAQAGAIAIKILKGTPPKEIPIERPTRFTLSFNLKTAKALGLSIPPSLLGRPDEIIQ